MRLIIFVCFSPGSRDLVLARQALQNTTWLGGGFSPGSRDLVLARTNAQVFPSELASVSVPVVGIWFWRVWVALQPFTEKLVSVPVVGIWFWRDAIDEA